MRIAACQVPDIREDVEASLTTLEDYAAKASHEDAHLVLFPECFLQGYLTEEAAARQSALDLRSAAFSEVLDRLAPITPALVFGIIELDNHTLFNSAVVVSQGKLLGVYRKTHLLPGESIFKAGNSYPIFKLSGIKFGINICYDTQFPEAAAALATQGANLILCPANNMMRRQSAEKWKHRHNEMRRERAKETELWILSADVTGERDDRIGYGPTSLISPSGSVVAQVPLHKTGMIVHEVVITAPHSHK